MTIHYNQAVYVISFSYPSRLDSYPRWAGGGHGDDMVYIFGAALTDGIDPFVSTFTRYLLFLISRSLYNHNATPLSLTTEVTYFFNYVNFKY